MLKLILILLAIVATWLSMFARNRNVDPSVSRKILIPFLASVGTWLLWFGIREYIPPISIGEHWVSVLIALLALGLAALVSLRLLWCALIGRVPLVIVSVIMALFCLFSAVLSIPVS